MDTDTTKLVDLKKVHKHATYTNTILNTITKHLNQLNAKTDSKKKATKKDIASASKNPFPLLPKALPNHLSN